MTKNPYHRFLIRHRVYCELCSAPMPATHVIQHKFKTKVVCDAHYRAHTPIESGLALRSQLERNQ
jgi:hypothetical protein